jgi:hypothetical protein
MMTKLIDYLPNVNWVLSGANCYGRALEFQDRFCAEAILLEHEHTLKHFKDMWIPKLFDRTHFITLINMVYTAVIKKRFDGFM